MEELYISWDDLKRVYQKKKWKIAKAAQCGALLCLAYFLFSPPSYEAAATFKQSSTRNEQGADLKKFIRTFSNGVSEGATAPLILSRTVLTKTIEELGLQAVVEEHRFLAKKILAFRDNIFAAFKRNRSNHETFHFQNVHYEGEKTHHFFLRFAAPDRFELLDQQQKLLEGRLGEEIHYGDITFTLARAPASVKIEKTYRFSILPRQAIIPAMKRKISVKPLREDKNIVAITFSDTDRQKAAAVVNTLMSKYEEFLIEENKSVIGAELQYLDKRQDELNAKLDLDIKDHVAVLKKNLLEQGFMGIQEELEAILEPLQTYRTRLNEIEVERAALEKRTSQTDLAPLDAPKLVQQFGKHLGDQIQEASLLLQKLEKDETVSTNALPRETFAALLRDVQRAKELWITNKEALQKQLYDDKKQDLTAHLRTFVEHLSLRQKNLQESARYIDTLETDLQSMTLPAVRSLSQQYSHQLDELHAQLKQVVFFRDHLNEPHFEISTLSNVLTDSVTGQLVQKSSELEAQLCDAINRSGKEHERLKEALSIQKRFLESHLSQTLELGKIRIQLIQEKIGSLSHAMKDLLQKEKAVLENKIADLKQTLQEIPELWHLDKRLKFKAELTKGMMEGLTHIAESKNLSRHLYQVESRPLDTALAPTDPHPPRLLLKSLGGGAFVAAALYLFFLLQAFYKGLPSSLATLRLRNAHTSGAFSSFSNTPFDQLPDSDLETLRKMASFILERKNKTGTVVSLLSQRGSDFYTNLSSLLALHQQKILVIDCNFDRIATLEEQPGLWDYLNKNSDNLPLRPLKNYDFLPAGGTTRHGVELLSSSAFLHLLSERRSQYDFIFLLRRAPLSSYDAAQLLSLSDLAIITTDEESDKSLFPYLHWSRQKENDRATFAQYPIMTE